MTFTLPKQTAEALVRRVPSQKRSGFVAAAVEQALSAEAAEMARACKIVNKIPDIKRIEREWDAIDEEVD